MKKVAAGLIMFLSVVFFSANLTTAAGIGGAVKLGVDFSGDHEVSGLGLSGTEDVDTGFSVSGELFAKIGNMLDIGGGTTFQIPRSQKDYPGDFYFIPFYGAVRVRFENETITPYFIGQVGYNLFGGDSDYTGTGIYEGDLEGGLYWGLGGGVLIKKHFLIEALYSVNYGTVEVLGNEFDVEYSKVTINAGYNF